MSRDLSQITDGWDYDPGKVNARLIEADDGSTRLQLRLDLGVLQMRIEGRPDGRRPHGYDSLLDYWLRRDATSPGDGIGTLTVLQCAELQQEAVQYYYRYLGFSTLQMYDAVIRDTQHNLALFDFVRRRAPDEQTAWQFLQFYPYVRMMSAQATAQKHVAEGRYDEALRVTEQAMAEIRAFAQEHGLSDVSSRMQEIQTLSELLLNIRSRTPANPADALRAALKSAIEAEDYERAATLRDELKRMQ